MFDQRPSDACAAHLRVHEQVRHLRRMRSVYRERQQCLREQLAQHFGDRLRIHGGHVGVHLACEFAPGIDDRAISRRAAALGVTARALSDCCAPGPGQPTLTGLVLGYGLSDEQQIRPRVPRLRQAYDEVG